MEMNADRIANEFASSIKREYGDEITEVLLFGSAARGESTSESDIDILVICRGNRFKLRRKMMAQVLAFLLKHGVYISLKTLSEEDWSNLDDTALKRNISKEGVVIG